MAVLYQKYRPRTLEQIVGQEPIVTILSNAIRYNKLNNAYLFQGPKGTGKTSVARIFARIINCTSKRDVTPCNNECMPCQRFGEDYIEIDAASNRGIKDVQELLERLHYRPKYASQRVIVIDECHQLTTDAIGALLKTVEEPPPYIVFIFCTTHPLAPTRMENTKQEDALKTLVSRCMHLLFKAIDPSIIQRQLAWICEQENQSLPDEILLAITRNAGGSLRDAESLLDAVFVGWGKNPSPESIAWLFPPEEETAIQLLEDLASPSPYTSLARINDGGLYIKLLIRHQLGFLSDALNLKLNQRVLRPHETVGRIQYLADGWAMDDITSLMSIVGHIRGDTILDMELGLINAIQYLASDKQSVSPIIEKETSIMEAPPLTW